MGIASCWPDRVRIDGGIASGVTYGGRALGASGSAGMGTACAGLIADDESHFKAEFRRSSASVEDSNPNCRKSRRNIVGFVSPFLFGFRAGGCPRPPPARSVLHPG